MSSKISNTVFSGDASDTLITIDAYLSDERATHRLEQAIIAGNMDDKLGIPDIPVQDADIPKTNTDKQDAKEEKADLPIVVEKVADLSKQKYNQAAKMSEQRANKENEDAKRADALRAAAATKELGPMLPTHISSACARIVDKFKNKLFGNKNRYDVKGQYGVTTIASDAVQCALDAFKMLGAVTGIKDQLKTTVVDTEAEAQVLAGMIAVLMQNGMKEDVPTVLDTAATDNVKKRALGLASPDIIEAGDVHKTNWMFDQIGTTEVEKYIPDLTTYISMYYENKARLAGTDDAFLQTLTRVDPNWDQKNGLYNFDTIGKGSPDAIRAFDAHPPYRAIAMTKDVNYFQTDTIRAPSALEVTRDLYPKAIGPANFIPA